MEKGGSCRKNFLVGAAFSYFVLFPSRNKKQVTIFFGSLLRWIRSIFRDQFQILPFCSSFDIPWD